MYRIFSECQLHSATGRVSLSEPNLQNIPKDFEIKMPGSKTHIYYISYIFVYKTEGFLLPVLPKIASQTMISSLPKHLNNLDLS